MGLAATSVFFPLISLIFFYPIMLIVALTVLKLPIMLRDEQVESLSATEIADILLYCGDDISAGDGHRLSRELSRKVDML